jgi:hypothetical protein
MKTATTNPHTTVQTHEMTEVDILKIDAMRISTRCASFIKRTRFSETVDMEISFASDNHFVYDIYEMVAC